MTQAGKCRKCPKCPNIPAKCSYSPLSQQHSAHREIAHLRNKNETIREMIGWSTYATRCLLSSVYEPLCVSFGAEVLTMCVSYSL